MLSRPVTCKWRNKVWWMMGWLVRLKAAELLMQTDAEVLLKTISTCDVLNFQGKREFCWGNTLLCMLLYVWKEVSVFWFIAYRGSERSSAILADIAAINHCHLVGTRTPYLSRPPAPTHWMLFTNRKSTNSQGVRTNCAFQYWMKERGCVGQRLMAVITMSRISSLTS